MVAEAEAQRKRARAAGLEQQKQKQQKQQRVDVAAISSTDPTLPNLKIARRSLEQSGGESGPRTRGCVLCHAASSSSASFSPGSEYEQTFAPYSTNLIDNLHF